MTFPFSPNGEGTVVVGDGTVTVNNAVLDNESVTISFLAPEGYGKSFRVTEIGTYAFIDRDTMKSLWIPSSVVVINDRAFRDYDYLTLITIESGSKLEYIMYRDLGMQKQITRMQNHYTLYEKKKKNGSLLFWGGTNH